MTATAALFPELQTEEQFCNTVMQTAHLLGWLTMHERPALRKDGRWMTPATGDGAGWPDLVLCRPPRFIIAELKSERGRIAPLQQRWLDALGAVPGLEVYIWRPSMQDEITAVLA